MLHSCGQSHYQLKKNRFGINTFSPTIYHFSENPLFCVQKQLYTSYLGSVNVNVVDEKEYVSLETYHTINGRQILVKVVDAKENSLNDKNHYSLSYLRTLPAKKINISQNQYAYFLLQLCNKKFAQLNQNNDLIKKLDVIIKPFMQDYVLTSKALAEYPELTSESPIKSVNSYKKIFQHLSSLNDAVDIFFNTINYLDFLYTTTGLVSVAGLDSLISISNVPDLDNAFFTGEYMVFGAGSRMFYPLSSIDVVGHELSHGLVSGTADLEYRGHSGALNESFSDIMGTMFEFYMYDKYPQLGGKSDWFIGEDLAIDTPFLRSMENPLAAQQPNKYKGEFYLDPNSQIDNGGVHINSGITNYCFYLACQKKDKFQVLSMFLECLYCLNNQSNFVDFRDKLKICSKNDPVLIESLKTVGLDDSMVCDYPPDYRNPRPVPQPNQQKNPQPNPNPWPVPQYPFPQRTPMPQPVPQYPFPQRTPMPQRMPQPVPQYPFPQRTPMPQRMPQYVPQYPFPQRNLSTTYLFPPRSYNSDEFSYFYNQPYGFNNTYTQQEFDYNLYNSYQPDYYNPYNLFYPSNYNFFMSY